MTDVGMPMGMTCRGRKIDDAGEVGRLLEMACVGKRGWDLVPSGKAVLVQDHRQFTHSSRGEGRA